MSKGRQFATFKTSLEQLLLNRNLVLEFAQTKIVVLFSQFLIIVSCIKG
jgi:hypothetical protein